MVILASLNTVGHSANSWLFRYLGEGDTLEEARRPAPNPGRMSPLVDGSISDRIVRFACR